MSSNRSDDRVGTGETHDHGRQTAEQKAVLGGGGEDGRVEPKSAADWAERGAAGGEPGRAPVAKGGSSQGHSDGKPAGREGVG